MIELREVDAFYGRAQVLFAVSLEVRRGEVVALLGRNGAGKSTTLKTVMGLLPARAGTVEFAGSRIAGRAPFEICRAGLGYVPEDRRIFPDLTVEQNLEVARRPARTGLRAWTPERAFELFPSLGRLRGRAAGRMSGGEQQMLTIARTLMGNPLALLLDEPSEGLAPVIVAQMRDVIGALRSEGLTLLVSEQNPRFAAAITDRVYILEKGRICYADTMQALLADPATRDAHLAV
ncbi:MAG: ATP-binding cassette domain-containing protein [Betaproteobacteria bacterium]|nr:ATP-binding cassette domain-containing protein [Betaproteobacteria bacterium]